MGKTAKEQLNRALSSHLNNIHETLQILDVAPASSVEKVNWKDVIQMSEQVSKEATNVGMLYSCESPGVKALEESMAAYFNILRGFLYVSHGSLVGAGPTMSSCIHKSVKQVVDTSFMLFQEAVSSYGQTSSISQKQKIPQLVGAVWDACSDVKKAPTTNVTAIGRQMTQVAVSIKDVLREMKELKPASTENKLDDGDSDGDLGNDLSPEEMKVVQLTTSVVSETLTVLKELIRSITSLLKQETVDSSCFSVTPLESLLKLCQAIGVQVDELGACLYPPQELSEIKVAMGQMLSFTSQVEVQLKDLKIYTDDFSEACSRLRDSLRNLESELGVEDISSELDNLAVH